ncbi:MAG: HlyD family efflux transporter periplasmic adaptor subunit [Clostridia bacterium]|nr:HlyD family efflux transporter periplasmic adaptor subunit [Clostridia bacterium]
MAISRKKNRRRKTLSAVLIALALLIAGAAVGVKLLRERVTQAYGAKSNEEAQKATVTVGSISTTISGSGTLAAQEVTEVTLPRSVALRSLCVEEGDEVAAGDVLAYVDLTSILTAMNELQKSLEDLDEDIAAAAKETVDTVVKSTVTGRVKAIYCENGDPVLSVMYEHGALLTISLDGYLAVDVPAGALSEGDALTVTLSDGTAYSGTVGERKGDAVAVLITDDHTPVGDEVTVADGAENVLGTGQLYIHQPLNVTGYAGTVSRLSVAENTPVTKNRILMYLSDTAFTANYDALLQQRAALEEDLNELIALYKVGVVRAPLAGKVESVQAEQETAEGAEIPEEWTIASIRPQEQMIVTAAIDESNILSVELGQSASVTISSVGDDPFTGEVTSVEKTGTSNSGVTSYAVEVTLERTEKMLPQMSATVSIRIEGVDDALLLPEDAVTRTRNAAYVYTSVDETTGELSGMTEVKTGLSGGGYVEIMEGLQEGDTVYYTQKQANDFSSFMGGFGGGNNRGGNSGNSGWPGGGMPGGSGGGMPGGSGSGRPSGSGSGSGRPSGRNGG